MNRDLHDLHDYEEFTTIEEENKWLDEEMIRLGYKTREEIEEITNSIKEEV